MQNDLILGCETVNYCKSRIKASVTHPDYNYYSLEEKNNIDKKLYLFRKRLSNLPFTSPEHYLQQMTNVANCLELAMISLFYLVMAMRDNPAYREAHVLTYVSKTADHCLTVFSRKQMDFENWKNCIFVDGWSGDVFLASKFQSKVYGYYYVQSTVGRYNLLRELNGEYDEFYSQYSYQNGKADFKYPFTIPIDFSAYSAEQIAEYEKDEIAKNDEVKDEKANKVSHALSALFSQPTSEQKILFVVGKPILFTLQFDSHFHPTLLEMDRCHHKIKESYQPEIDGTFKVFVDEKVALDYAHSLQEVMHREGITFLKQPAVYQVQSTVRLKPNKMLSCKVLVRDNLLIDKLPRQVELKFYPVLSRHLNAMEGVVKFRGEQTDKCLVTSSVKMTKTYQSLAVIL